MFKKIFLSKEKRQQSVQTSLIEEFRYPKYGPGQLWETVAEDVQAAGGDVRIHCDVTAVETDGKRITAVRYLRDGEETRLEGDAFFSSMPVKDFVCGISNPPADIAALANDLPYRDFVTVGLLVDRLSLKNETQLKTLGNIIPDCWIYVQDRDVKLGRVQIFNNWSPYMVKDPEHTVWVGLEYFCSEGDDFWTMDAEDCIALATDELIKIGMLQSREDVLDSRRERVQKAYPAYFDSYEHMDAIIRYLDRYQNLFCIGRNGQHRYNNMDHSMVTAFEAVENLTTGRTDKHNIWSVNTEKEYHEEK